MATLRCDHAMTFGIALTFDYSKVPRGVCYYNKGNRLSLVSKCNKCGYSTTLTR